MKNVINFHDVIKDLASHNLKIDDKKTFNFYIKNFNLNTIINNYSEIFYENKNKKRYSSKATSTQLINLYKFDHDLGNHILRYILVIEKILNTNVAYETINQFHIVDKCLLKINTKYIEQNILVNFDQVDIRMSFNSFFHSLVKYCSTNLVTKKYANINVNDEIKKWENCPLDILCLTWSFATTFSIFIAINNNVKYKILNNFNLYPKHLNGFVDFIKNILHMRNLISHNYVIFNADVKYQSQQLNEIYEFVFKKKTEHISTFNLIEMIQFFSFNDTLVSNTKYYLKKMKVQQEFKNKIIEELNK